MGLSFKEKYSFGLGALGKDLCYAIVSSYLMIYFTDSIGLAPAFVGGLFLVARLWDALNDPMMGMVVDNTRTRWGKFRPWILIGTIINAVILVFLFKKPAGLEGTALHIYYSAMYILWGMSYTVMDIPYWSMLPSLSKTKEERDQMSVIPRIFASSAWLIVGTFGLAIVNKLGNGNQTKGYEFFALAIAIVFVITTIITVVNVKDSSSQTTTTNSKKEDKTSIKKAFKIIKENDQLMVFIGVVLAYNLFAQLSGGASIYYFKYVTGNENLYPVYTAFASLAEIGGLMFFPILSKNMSKKGVFRLACYLPAAGLIMLLLAGIIAPANAILVAVSGIVVKLGSGFTLGATTLYLDGKIHALQKELLILEGNMKEEEDVNAAINVDMLKFASFDKIKSTAENELGMVYPSSESTISIDMSKEYFSHLKNEESKKSGLLQKIIAAFN